MEIFFSVGEPSGDLHGANIIRELRRRRPDIGCVGYGGPKMAAAGCQLHADLTELAVMWVLNVILNIHKFVRLLLDANRYFYDYQPDAVVLIDYPGFNWWIARRAKAHNIPVFYYGAPQLWAWAGWRTNKMRKLTDHVLCKLPFEEAWFRGHGINATHVGHPYFDELLQRKIDHPYVEKRRAQPGRLVTVLPGSRLQEIHNNLPVLLRASQRVRDQLTDTRVAVASYNQRQAELARKIANDLGIQAEVAVGKTAELIEVADCCLACSGSVSLELMYHAKPSVIVYRVSKLAYWLQGRFRTSRYITLVNLLASPLITRTPDFQYDPDDPEHPDAPFPEYLTHHDPSAQMAAHVVRWFTNDALRNRLTNRLANLRSQFVHAGATATAATYLLTHLQPNHSTVRMAPPIVPTPTPNIGEKMAS